MRLIFDKQPIEFEDGDSVLVAILRAGLQPGSGGCLCLEGDCPHCLATIDGVAYTRTCQTMARPGLIVDKHPADTYPALPLPASRQAASVRHIYSNVAVIGQGLAGQQAAVAAAAQGKSVTTLEAANGQEVVGIYDGPLVVARTASEMLHVHAGEIIVATGAAELQPVAPGNLLKGIMTARAAEKLAKAGIALGRVVAIGRPPAGVVVSRVEPSLIRFEGEESVSAVIVRDDQGNEHSLACDTVTIGLGFQPRDTLLRMGNGLAVRAVGDAAGDSDIPPCPIAGVVCACSGVSVHDLQSVWDRGFRELELVKRATLAGTGACQGSMCLPYIRSFLANRGGELQPPFTARPVTRQPTIGEAAAGAYHRPTPRTALDSEHRRLGARMDRIGGWWRPYNYGDTLQEYWAVREAVSIGDVSTLGKMLVSGPDALELLERLYPTKVSSIASGRARYVLMLDERGYVLDDGLICRDSQTRYYLTFTSGGSSFAEMWVRDWAETWGLDVRLLYQTMSVGAINVTGPLARELLLRAGLSRPPDYMQHTHAVVAGFACRVMRLSFTGELSYELHHRSDESVGLWQKLLELGQPLGIRPHGIETLLKLRLEKGHVIVGQDTDFDSTPRRINMEWAIKRDKPDFIGRQGLLRTNQFAPDRQLVGLEMDGRAPIEGATIWHDGDYAGYVTSSTFSPALDKTVMLGWLKYYTGSLPAAVTVDGRQARRVPTPFYDQEGARARA
jgi:glycine cleavage system aminomethyltransferase T